jgi:radical SAM superfamily enzyme YgiQ (UPF0313 family)
LHAAGNGSTRLSDILFIHPPVAKICEPPSGIAVLVGVLRRAGVLCAALDLNLEGMLALLQGPVEAADTWTRRAVRHGRQNLELIRRPEMYAGAARYQRAVADLNRLVEQAALPYGVKLSLANYQDRELTPTRSLDLLRAAEKPKRNPFFRHVAPRLDQAMARLQPKAVGFSLNYLSQALCAMALIGHLRRTCPGLAVILGGGLVTSWMRGPNWPRGAATPVAPDARPGIATGTCVGPFAGLVDVMVAGPGEGPLLRYFGKIVPDAAVHGEPAQGAAAQGAPDQGARAQGAPDFSPFSLGEYLAPGGILPYAASRGCYWNRCAFCPEMAEGNRYAPLGKSRVVAELRFLVRHHKPVLIHLLDNALSPALMRELIRHPPGVPWYGFVRFERILDDPDFCRALRRAGCVMLKLGLESGSQDVLDREGKGVDLGLAVRVLRNLRAAAIGTYVYLLFGTPSEAEDEARATLEFTVRHSEHIGFLNLAVFNLPLAGRGRDTVHAVPYGDDLSLYADFVHPRGWNRSRTRRFLNREFRRHPAIAPILRRDPPLFTSNHAPFFVTDRPQSP